MANDETKTVLDEPSVAAVRLMLGKLPDHHVAEAYVWALASEQRPLGVQAPTGSVRPVLRFRQRSGAARGYARQGIDMEPTVKMGHASAALERRAEREQIAAGKEPHAVTPRGQVNEAIRETRTLEPFIERGREWLQEVEQRVRELAELAAQNLAGFVQGAARTMRELHSRPENRFEALPALDQSPRRDHTPAIEPDQLGQGGLKP